MQERQELLAQLVQSQQVNKQRERFAQQAQQVC